MTAHLETRSLPELAASQLREIAHLWFTIWPKPNLTVDDYERDLWERAEQRPSRQLHVLSQHGRVCAAAESFARPIETTRGPLVVMALASVCSAESHRGLGFGRQVVQAAFARVDAGEFPLALFQTQVPDFYVRLGARTVDNPFGNGRATGDPAANPFWDPHIMIYPARADWPAGPVDLCGPGY